MATMILSWFLVIAAVVLAVELCAGETACVFWSSAGSVVQLGSSFEVFCTFSCKGQGSMYLGNNLTPERPSRFNSTTIYLKVTNITEKRTYSCRCKSPPVRDPCGLDILAGYPPDRPNNISCIYKLSQNERGDVVCTWNSGRDAHLWNSFELRVITVSGNHSEGPALFRESSRGTKSPSFSFSVPAYARLISVWVQSQNALGSAESPVINYTLSDIVMPSTPVLRRPECSSRRCTLRVEQSVRIQHLEVQHAAGQLNQWESCLDPTVEMNSSQAWSIPCLEPNRLYYFRARSKFSTGLWSPWSSNISGRTEDEAPSQALDVWVASASDSKSMRIYWKEASVFVPSGRITEYILRVHDVNRAVVANVSADVSSHSVPLCSDCEVTVWASNSKGLSPPATVKTHRTKATPLQDVQTRAGSKSITISWRKPETAPTMYVLEWYPEGRMLEELRWLRLDQNKRKTVITDIKPSECYEGAVYVFYNESSVSRTGFKRAATMESAPKTGPSVLERVEGKNVVITWRELPRGQRGGCITNYTIYQEDSRGKRKIYVIQATDRMYVIKDLAPSVYTLWIRASTAKGKGPPGQKIKFFISEDSQLSFSLLYAVAAVMLLFILCLCQRSTLKHRFWGILKCLMLDVVPDPANSKWAKECTKEKGQMNLQLPSGDSTLTDKEEETLLVDVEELFAQQLLPPAGPGPETELYPALTAYIKSFSHDSDSTDHTHASLDTTVDYISSHGPGLADDGDEDEDEDFAALDFFPSHNVFLEPLELGGKLTLDAVRIDCTDFCETA
ncbi:interleukin-12 receptor subunit beta-2 isoform 1-T2 [Menidia menidia]